MSDGLIRDADGYLPISGYGLIGDCRSAALVGVDGSIDWLCLPRFDDAPIFGRIIDARKGGYWSLAPRRTGRRWQRYRDLTNILDTIHRTPTGMVVVTDFMPVDEHDLQQYARLHNEPRIVRIVECLAGEVTMRQVFHPSLNFTRIEARCEVHPKHIHAELSGMHLRMASTPDIDGLDSTFKMHAGETAAFALRAGKPGASGAMRWSVERARALLRSSQDYWWRWAGQIRYRGPYFQHVSRSALALKLMTYSPTGAIVAAPTTSLPESIGGPRNWDYRFTWLRDASFTLYAFFQLGLTGEAEAFFHWLSHRKLGQRRSVPNLFNLDGRSNITEVALKHIDGYRHSRPVRVGNGAVHQLQLDVYGEVLDSAYLYARFGGRITHVLWRELAAIVEHAIDRWQEPDSSIWEVRSERQHYTYSKVMCWVAVDRGLRLAERFGFPHDSARWRAARRAIRQRVITDGYSARRRAFTQAIGSNELDAAVLRIPQVRFLPNHDPRVASTVRAIERDLGSGPLVRRYDVNRSDDGIGGEEGSFFMVSFWLVDALAHLGDLEIAQRRFERLLSFGSPLGLFSEEVDNTGGVLLGNYPQAFTHLALVGAAVNIERARNRKLGVRGLRALERRRAA